MRDLFNPDRKDVLSRIEKIPSFSEIIESIKIVLRDIGKNLELCLFEDGEYYINGIRFKKIGNKVYDMSTLRRDDEFIDIHDVYSGRIDVQEHMEAGKFNNHLNALLMSHQVTKYLVEEKTRADNLISGMLEKFKDPCFSVAQESSKQDLEQDPSQNNAQITIGGAVVSPNLIYHASPSIDTFIPSVTAHVLTNNEETKPKKEKKVKKDKKKDEKKSKKKDKGK